jgi:excisionase family DNA binding protein
VGVFFLAADGPPAISAMTNNRRKLSPAEVGAQLSVGRSKVMAWIKSGELRAVNLATKTSGRPRFRIDVADLKAFEQQRLVRPHEAQPRHRRRSRSPPTDVIEFF